jgi:hypothetical protein
MTGKPANHYACLLTTTALALAGCRFDDVKAPSLRDEPKPRSHEECYQRYPEYRGYKAPESLDQLKRLDEQCRLVICPTCPKEKG